MKKQGDFYLKFISIALAVAIVAYLVCSAVFSTGANYSLETALYCEVGDGVTVSGFVVRDETVLTSGAPIVVSELTEGQRVGAGQTVATGYQSGDARQSRQELADLQNELAQLRYAISGEGSAEELDQEISSLIAVQAAQVVQGRWEAVQTTAAQLKPLVLRAHVTADDTADINTRIRQIEARIQALTSLSDGEATEITAGKSGYFSQVVDGYEHLLTPGSLEGLTIYSLENLVGLNPNVPETALGRLVFGQTWYFACTVPSERAAGLEEGDRLTVSFLGLQLQQVPMRIYFLGEETEGQQVLVLSCNRLLQEVTSLRRLTADIVFTSYEGLRVPKTALYVVDGKTGVYILEAGRAEWKPVTVLYDYGDEYVVEYDSSDTDNLWPQDEIILTVEDLYDGKVME